MWGVKQLIAGIKGSKPGSGPPRPDGHLSKEESHALDQEYRGQRNETLRLKNFKEQMLLAKARGELVEKKIGSATGQLSANGDAPAGDGCPADLLRPAGGGG